MLTLTKEASEVYVKINRLYGEDVKKGNINSIYARLLALIHDKYKAIQLNHKLGAIISKTIFEGDEHELRAINLIEGWKLHYILFGDEGIKVIAFTEPSSQPL